MISHGKEIKVFTGNSNPELAHDICAQLYQNLGSSTVSQFADGECSISVFEPVRGKDVFIVQSTCGPVNDNLMELLIMIDAMRRASAGRITAVIPYFGYARQDRKAKSRDPISAKLVANLITAAGADRVLTMDLHAAQIQGFFDIPVDNLMGAHLFSKHYVKMFGKGNEDLMVVSPDVGSTARARAFSMKLGVNMAIVDKRREKANQSEVMNIIGNVEGDLHPARRYRRHRRLPLRRGEGHQGDRRCEGSLRLRDPRRSLRPRSRAHREQLHQGNALPRHHPLPRGQAQARKDQLPVHRSRIRGSHPQNLRGSLHLQPVRLIFYFRGKPCFSSVQAV